MLLSYILCSSPCCRSVDSNEDGLVKPFHTEIITYQTTVSEVSFAPLAIPLVSHAFSLLDTLHSFEYSLEFWSLRALGAQHTGIVRSGSKAIWALTAFKSLSGAMLESSSFTNLIKTLAIVCENQRSPATCAVVQVQKLAGSTIQAGCYTWRVKSSVTLYFNP